MKQLKVEPPVYITLLPATPALYLQEYPSLATRVFSAERPPVSCPLNEAACRFLECRITMRGSPATSLGPEMLASIQGHHPQCSPYMKAVTTASKYRQGGDHRNHAKASLSMHACCGGLLLAASAPRINTPGPIIEEVESQPSLIDQLSSRVTAKVHKKALTLEPQEVSLPMQEASLPIAASSALAIADGDAEVEVPPAAPQKSTALSILARLTKAREGQQQNRKATGFFLFKSGSQAVTTALTIHLHLYWFLYFRTYLLNLLQATSKLAMKTAVAKKPAANKAMKVAAKPMKAQQKPSFMSFCIAHQAVTTALKLRGWLAATHMHVCIRPQRKNQHLG